MPAPEIVETVPVRAVTGPFRANAGKLALAPPVAWRVPPWNVSGPSGLYQLPPLVTVPPIAIATLMVAEWLPKVSFAPKLRVAPLSTMTVRTMLGSPSDPLLGAGPPALQFACRVPAATVTSPV